MIYTKKKLVIVACVLALIVTPVTALAQGAQDDWKTRICVHPVKFDNGRCHREVDVYIKEYKPRNDVTCWLANAEGKAYDSRAGENVSISCIKE
jgi:hypothetical protein